MSITWGATRRMGDANIPGYNRALVAPTGFASDPYPLFNNFWQNLAYQKQPYAAKIHPVMGTQIVPPNGLGRMRLRTRMRGLGSTAPRVYNPLRLGTRRRMRGLGDLQPYGLNTDGSPVWIDTADGTVYDSSGNPMDNLSQLNTTAGGQVAAMAITGVGPAAVTNVLPASLNVGPPSQIYVSSGPGGIAVTRPLQPPPQPTSWFSKSSGIMGLSNGAVVAGAAGAAALLGLLGSSRRK